MLFSITIFPLALLAFSFGLANGYKLVSNYDSTNWYSSFDYSIEPDYTGGFVQYIDQTEAKSLGLSKIIGKQVYMGVDNKSIISTSSTGRKSIMARSKIEFQYGLLIGDFAHMPGSICGTWPAFGWTIRNNMSAPAGEIDIVEGFNDGETNYMTLHTNKSCSFKSPANQQTGTPNEDRYDCFLGPNSDQFAGCSVIGTAGAYGTSFNKHGGGVYALQWTSTFIKIFYFPRNAIPADITSGNPNPSAWGLPMGNFDSKYGNCDIDANFPPQTIYFDTTFCGEDAGGASWTEYSDCSVKTGVPTCEAYVAGNPGAFSEAYWLVNSVKVYQ